MICYAVQRTDDGRYMRLLNRWGSRFSDAALYEVKDVAILLAMDEERNGIPCKVFKIEIEEVE